MPGANKLRHPGYLSSVALNSNAQPAMTALAPESAIVKIPKSPKTTGHHYRRNTREIAFKNQYV